jgi:UDP-glucose 4-epimerase
LDRIKYLINMKILVTGGAGFVGTNLLKYLVKFTDFDLFSIDNYSIGSHENHLNGVEYINDDINNLMNYSNDYELIFHLAALSRIQPSFEMPREFFTANLKGTSEVLEFARKNNSKVIYSGSSSKHHNPSISPYAMSKYLGEQLCELYRTTFGLNIHIVRFYNVYGPNEIMFGKWAAVIGKWRGQIENQQRITIVGDGNQKRDFTHIFDIVSGLIKISNSVSNRYLWELGTKKNYSLIEVYNIFKLKFNCECEFVNNQKGNYKETLRVNDYALDELNWRPIHNLKDYILNL